MGGVASILDCSNEDPVTYMEREYQRRREQREGRKPRKADIMTSALYGAFAEVKVLAKKKEHSYIQGLGEGEDDEEMEKAGDSVYRERRNSGDSVASFMTNVREIDYQVSTISLILFF